MALPEDAEAVGYALATDRSLLDEPWNNYVPQVLDYQPPKNQPPRREYWWLVCSFGCSGGALLLQVVSLSPEWELTGLAAFLMAILAIVFASIADVVRDPNTVQHSIVLAFLAAMGTVLIMLCTPSLGR